MDGFIGELGNRLKVSITDSTMMSIVNNAMDKAHAKVKSDGVIGRLNEISRFYELAVIQLEGCMRLVQEEAEDTSHRDLVYDLGQVRNHLLGRLEEAEIAISQKDREMIEIWDNVLKLRQALELRERELEEALTLRPNTHNMIMVEKRSKSAGAAEMVNLVLECEKGGVEFGELKKSVDQQVWSMRQNYERSRINIKTDEMNNNSIDSKRIDRMGWDIANLKETFDMAFGKMQSACETGPVEQQWKWSIERDVTALLIKGLIKDIHHQLYWFSVSFLNFQQSLHDCLLTNNLRLAGINCELDSLSQQSSSLKNRELLYKNAFARRCLNLKMAENEVDLLGDQVDSLFGLLETIYVKLYNYSQHHDSEISEILEYIKKELGGKP